MTLGRKLFFYTSGLLVCVLLIAFVVLEREQARQWQDYQQVQQVAFARFATPELLKHYRGNFSEAAGPAHREQLKGLLSFNPDLIKFTIFSPSGRLLVDPPPLQDIGTLPDLSADLRSASTSLDPISKTVRLTDGTRILEVIASAFGPTGARVVYVRYLFSYRSVDNRLAEMRQTFFTIALLAVGCSVLLVALVARSFTRPIHRLTAAVRTVSSGELNISIPSKGSDELADLAAAFNEMAASLEQNETELKSKNQQLQQANNELQQVYERLVRTERLAAVGQIAAGVSHEIDNPVGIILGYAELLIEDCAADDPRREDLRAIIAECQRCKKITGGLLGLARSVAQRREPVKLAALVQETLESLQPQKLFRDIDIAFAAAASLPQITGDADRIRQVLINLLLNSAQAMNGEGRILIELSAQQNLVQIEIHDTGPGISEENYQQIFEPFFSTKGPGEGTGLGLSVCRKLVEEHGGEIVAEPSPHGGALLRVSFPI